MMTPSDLNLLNQYARHDSEEAYATLVHRHLGLVYSAALRQVRSPQLAEEVAQSVFVDLARNADRMKPDTVLAAWLYQVTRRTAIDVVRRESRRQGRERLAMEMTDMNSHPSEWTPVEPLLDEAMDALDETDHSAILLRYFENQSLREVGATLGTSDDTAQKRVSRAVDRLREFFAKRGVTVGATGLVVVLSANAVQAAPAGLVLTISTAAALAGTAVHTSTAVAATKAIAMTTLQKTLITATLVIASAVTSLVIQHQSDARSREADRALQQQAEQLARTEAEHERLSNLAALAAGPSLNTPDALQKLRNEVAALRGQTNRLADLWEDRRQLQTSLVKARQNAQSPGVQKTVLGEEANRKRGYSGQLALAAMNYATRHQGQFPTNLAQALPYLRGETGHDTNFIVGEFDIVFTRKQTAVAKYAHPGRITLIRERQPWKNADGLWAKSYAFTDGNSQIVSVVDGDFEAWEKQHIVPTEPSNP